jgi:MFS family permease
MAKATSIQAVFDHRRRHLFIALFAGLLAGVLNAIFARLLMRGILLYTSGTGSFSWGGTAVIFAFGALVGPLFGLLYHKTIYKLRTHDLVKGLLFGLVLLSTIQVLGIYVSPEFRAELMAVGPLGFVVFTAMNLAFVLTLALMTGWLEREWPLDDSRHAIETTFTAVLGLLALGGLILLVVEIFGRLLGVVG